MPMIHFLDATNRDGVQTAHTGLSKFGKRMVNFYLGKLGVAQSELGFRFLFHEVPYIRANGALAAGAFSSLRLSGWCRAVPGDVAAAFPLGLRHYNLSISTSDQMITHNFRLAASSGQTPASMPPEEATMYPILHDELAKARLADFHRQAERDALARAARQARRARRAHGRTFLLAQAVTNLTRRIFAALRAAHRRPRRAVTASSTLAAAGPSPPRAARVTNPEQGTPPASGT